MLLVGIGEKRDGCVQGKIPAHSVNTVRVQEQETLGHQQPEHDQYQYQMQLQQRFAVPLPAHCLGGIDAKQTIQAVLNRQKDRSASTSVAGKHAGNVLA